MTPRTPLVTARTLVLVVAIFAPAIAMAQPPPSPAPTLSDPSDPHHDRSDELFREGVAAFDKGNYALCEKLLSEALGLRRAFDIAANLGTCELNQQKYRLAATHFQLALNVLPAGTKASKKEAFRNQLTEARAHLLSIYLTVNVAARVSIDGEQAVELDTDGPNALYVDPGDHQLVLEADGYEPHTEAVSGGAGEERRPSVTLSPQAPAVPLWAPITTGALTLVGIGVGVAMLVVGGSKADDARDLEADHLQKGDCGAASPCPDVPDAFAKADTFYLASEGLFIGAGVAALATVALTVVALTTGGTSDGPSAIVLPAISPTNAGLILTGSF